MDGVGKGDGWDNKKGSGGQKEAGESSFGDNRDIHSFTYCSRREKIQRRERKGLPNTCPGGSRKAKLYRTDRI